MIIRIIILYVIYRFFRALHKKNLTVAKLMDKVLDEVVDKPE